MEGIIHYGLLQRNLTVTAERYCQNFAVWRKQSSPCPIGLPPLLLSLQQSARRGVSFNNDAEIQNWLDEFFTAKPADFFKRGSKTCPNVGRQS
jgi:hypothetical protein